MRSALVPAPTHEQYGWLVALVVLTFGAGCRSVDSVSRTTPRLDRSVLTREQMTKGEYVTVFDAVVAMRSRWLTPRGPDSFLLPSIVWVYVDGSRAGGIDVLRRIQPHLVHSVRFFDGPTATGRWGVDNGSGVIHISTWSDDGIGIPLPDSTRPAAPRVRRDSITRE